MCAIIKKQIRILHIADDWSLHQSVSTKVCVYAYVTMSYTAAQLTANNNNNNQAHIRHVSRAMSDWLSTPAFSARTHMSTLQLLPPPGPGAPLLRGSALHGTMRCTMAPPRWYAPALQHASWMALVLVWVLVLSTTAAGPSHTPRKEGGSSRLLISNALGSNMVRAMFPKLSFSSTPKTAP